MEAMIVEDNTTAFEPRSEVRARVRSWLNNDPSVEVAELTDAEKRAAIRAELARKPNAVRSLGDSA